jgi:hypothetical protein
MSPTIKDRQVTSKASDQSGAHPNRFLTVNHTRRPSKTFHRGVGDHEFVME